MFDADPNICAPEDAAWAELSDQALKAEGGQQWAALAAQFVPLDRNPAGEMTAMLRDGIARRCMEFETHACYNDELLGFFSIDPQRLSIGNEGVQSVLMLSAIVRSAATEEGFGRVLIEQVVGRALTERDVKAIVVKPANKRVGRMWREDYHFEPVDKPEIPGLLYVAVDVASESELS
jgi:hypothetical protein